MLSQAHPYYYLVRLARIGVSGADIDAPEVCALILLCNLKSTARQVGTAT